VTILYPTSPSSFFDKTVSLNVRINGLLLHKSRKHLRITHRKNFFLETDRSFSTERFEKRCKTN